MISRRTQFGIVTKGLSGKEYLADGSLRIPRNPATTFKGISRKNTNRTASKQGHNWMRLASEVKKGRTY